MNSRIFFFALGLIAAMPAAGMAKADGADGDRLQQRFARMDLDSNGRVTLDEMETIRAERLAKADANGDGAVTLEELKSVVQRDGERMERRFQRMDLDGDGRVTKAESTQVARKWFEAVDKNGDGGITVGELQQWRPRGPGKGGAD